MTVPILLTKVILPHRRDEILTRRRLIEQVDRLMEKKLVVVTAPAGYGKTTLLVDYARRSNMPVCWYSIDPADQEIHRFITHFIASIEQRFFGFGKRSKAVLTAYESGDVPLEHLLIAIINEIYNTIPDHFAIVLDDFHLVNHSEAVNEFLNRFIQDVDQNCHLVLLSRSLISLLDLPVMVARSEASGLGLSELIFRADEIKDLVRQNYDQVIPLSQAEALEQKTEGWITGLLLSTDLILQGVDDGLKLMRASGAGLFDYYIHQVLNRQSAEMQDFLLRTSFFEEFDAEMCEALLGPNPQEGTWHGTLKRVMKNNLFVIPIGEQSNWLRYHHLFRDFLQNQFEIQQPDVFDTVLKKMVEIYRERKEWERAYLICSRLGDIDWTITFLKQAGEPMVRGGRIQLLGSWLEALPATVIDQHPALLARQGIIVATQGDTSRGLHLLDRAIIRLRADKNHLRLAGTLVWRALVYYMLLDSERSLTDAKETLLLTEMEKNNTKMTRFRAEAYRILGQNYRMVGELDQAINHLSQALKIYTNQDDDQGANLIRLDLGALYLDAGEYFEALTCYLDAREYYQRESQFAHLAVALNNIGFVQHLNCEFSDAFSTYEQALEKAFEGGITRVQTPVLIGIGDLFVDLDAFDSAAEAYTRAHKLLANVGDHYLSVYLKLAEATVARRQNKLPEAKSKLDFALQLDNKKPSNYTYGLILVETGLQAKARGEHHEAQQIVSEAAHLFENNGQVVLAGRTYLILANIYYQLGDTRQAETWLDKAFTVVSALESIHILLPVARHSKSFLASINNSTELGRNAHALYERVIQFEDGLPELKHTLRFKDLTIPFTPPKLQIQAFGVARVTFNSQVIVGNQWQSQDSRDLLYLLLSEPQGLSRDQIGERLWPESSSLQLGNYFKNATYRLRRLLQQNVILYTQGLYRFNFDLDYEYDVERFQELIVEARESIRGDTRKASYQQAIDIYQGRYLPEANGSWCIAERERLHQLFLTAGLQLASLYLESSRYDMALEVGYRLIAEDPYLEQAYCVAMQAHAATGNKPAVLRQYENLKEILKLELDITPSIQTETLFSSLIN